MPVRVISEDSSEVYTQNSDHLPLATQPVKTCLDSGIGSMSKLSRSLSTSSNSTCISASFCTTLLHFHGPFRNRSLLEQENSAVTKTLQRRGGWLVSRATRAPAQAAWCSHQTAWGWWTWADVVSATCE